MKNFALLIFLNITAFTFGQIYSILNIKCDNTIKTVELFDIQGRLLQTQIVEKPTTSLHLLDKAKGIYFIKIISENGVKVEKINKE